MTKKMRTKVSNALLVSLAAQDALLGALGLWNGSLDCGIPAITFSIVGSLEGMLVPVNLERELMR